MHSTREVAIANISPRWLFGAYIPYAAFSIGAFVLTSGGWTGLIYLSLGPMVYGGGFLLLLVATAMGRPARIRLPWLFVVPLLATQAGAILLNRGDCGDAPCRYLFIGRILGDSGFYDPTLANIGVWCLFAYLALFLLLCLSPLFNRPNSDET